MSAAARIITDGDDMLYVRLPNGQADARAVLDFFNGLVLHYEYRDGDGETFYSQLEAHSSTDLREIFEILQQAITDQFCEFDVDEYDLYLRYTPDTVITEEEFIASVRAAKRQWMRIEDLIYAAEQLLSLLRDPALSAAPELTQGVEALHRTLTALYEHNGRNDFSVQLIFD